MFSLENLKSIMRARDCSPDTNARRISDTSINYPLYNVNRRAFRVC